MYLQTQCGPNFEGLEFRTFLVHLFLEIIHQNLICSSVLINRQEYNVHSTIHKSHQWWHMQLILANMLGCCVFYKFTNLWKRPWFPFGTPVACVVTIAINILNECSHSLYQFLKLPFSYKIKYKCIFNKKINDQGSSHLQPYMYLTISLISSLPNNCGPR